MKIAIEGCAHGELEKIYGCLEALQTQQNIKIDLLICCGDFQAVRNKDDLSTMAVPEKYQDICTFYKYYSGEKVAPVPTLFIGGNHEASNYLQELPYGGWVAPNIYYLGRAGVVSFGELRIGGISGIFKWRDYRRGLWEVCPYTASSIRSVYHVRSLDVYRLRQLRDHVPVMLSHDWPEGIVKHGDAEQLYRYKPFLREDGESGRLGSPAASELLQNMKPDYWFSAHLHTRFAAIVSHEASTNESDDTDTRFLALDKCLPRRKHLQILDLPEYKSDGTFKYDLEWLAVLKLTNHLLTVRDVDNHMPGPGCSERFDFKPTEEELATVSRIMGDDLTISPDTFVQTAPPYIAESPKGRQPQPKLNPQTVSICEKLGIDDPVQVVLSRSGRSVEIAVDLATFEGPQLHVQAQHDEIPLDDDTAEPPVAEVYTPKTPSRMTLPPPVTPVNKLLDSEDNLSYIATPASTCGEYHTLDTSCATSSGSENRSFKRRNESLYLSQNNETNEIEELDNTILSGIMTTPTHGKKTFKRRNEKLYTSTEEN